MRSGGVSPSWWNRIQPTSVSSHSAMNSAASSTGSSSSAVTNWPSLENLIMRPTMDAGAISSTYRSAAVRVSGVGGVTVAPTTMIPFVGTDGAAAALRAVSFAA